MSSAKEELIEQLLARSRELSTATVMFHTAIADTAGLSPVETKTTDYLVRLGPLTAKELAEHSGLKPASVTALIDRLEHKGFVRRRPHPEDGRKVLIEVDAAATQVDAALWDYLLNSMIDLCHQYSPEQLRTITEFIAESTTITQRSTEHLTAGDPS